MGAADATTALPLSDSRGGAFMTFQLSPALAAACCETLPPATGKTPRAKLIGAFPRESNGCVGTKPSNPVFERRNTPVTGRKGTNPLNPNPSPGDHTHPNTGSNIQPP